MNFRRTTMAMLLGTLVMTAALPVVAQTGAPRAAHPVPTTQATQAKPAARRARASLSVHAATPSAWVGQAVPVTVTAYFRDVEGVTLEGAPTLVSRSIVTSDLAKDPRQSTAMIDGERVLVAIWAGTVTPSAPGALDLTAELPVRIRYREAAPRVARAAPPPDPFADEGGGDPFDSLFDRMRQQMQQQMMQGTEEATGRVREEASQLKATTAPLDVRALPTANQPAGFSGAVGTFDIKASVPAAKAAVSDPVTLRVTVSGDVDLDRVDLPGVASSESWKAYPPHVVSTEALDAGALAGKSARTSVKMTGAPRDKVFEQVLVPLRGGDLTVPAIVFTSFDPATGTYLTRSTTPLTVAVDGAPGAVSVPPAPAPAPAAEPRASAPPVAAPLGPVPVIAPRHVLYGVLPVLLLVAGALLYRVVSRRREAWALRRSMRSAASAGAVAPFLSSAHRLIETRLSERWGVAPGEVTPSRVRERLGPDGDPLVDVLVADAALRFGRGGLDGAELGPLCRSVERSLRGAA